MTIYSYCECPRNVGLVIPEGHPLRRKPRLERSPVAEVMSLMIGAREDGTLDRSPSHRNPETDLSRFPAV